MARELPAELLREILSPPLLVSDDMFADSGAVSPFSKVDKSASDVLLVCKSWMRVATPWLYSTVIVRSMAQAKALAFALTNNPDFGKFIRRLRVEGAYGEYIWAAVKTAPNITDLCMTLTVWSDVPITGLVKSLAYINPRRVILTLSPDKAVKNKNHTTLLNALCTQIRAWSHLDTFKFAGSRVTLRRWSHVPDYIAFPDIVAAICASPNVKDVRLALLDWTDVRLDVILQLLESNAGRLVTVYKSSRESDSVWFESHLARLRAECSPLLLPRLRTEAATNGLDTKLSPSEVTLTDASAPESSNTDAWLLNPFYTPLGDVNAPIRRALLTQIIKNALETETPAQNMYTDQRRDWFDASRFDTAVARVLLTTSQEFESIAIEILIKHVFICLETHAEQLLNIISANPTLSARIETLQFRRTGELSPTAAQLELLETASNLVEVTTGLSEAEIQALVQGGSSATLRKLDLATPHSKVAKLRPLNIESFIALEELVINCAHSLLYPTKPSKSTTEGGTLPRLRRLQIIAAPKGLLESLITYDFPQLDYLYCRNDCLDEAAMTSLVVRHGGRIREARLWNISTALCDALPEMVELHWMLQTMDASTTDKYFSTNGHEKLRTLRVSAPTPSSNHRRKYTTQLNEMWTAFLTGNIRRSKFPALELVQMVEGNDVWPVNERNAKKSIWPALAEGLDRQGITLTDRDGRAWRRRLQ